METPQKQVKHRIPVVDFVPAELKKGKVWRIEFYVSDPTSKYPGLKRIQRRVKPMPNTRERERFAKRICYEINRKLERNWNPIIEQEAPKSLTRLRDVITAFLNNIQKQVKDGSLRPDTLRAYTSYLKNFETYLKELGEEDLFCLKYDRHIVGDFLDYIYYERENSPRTYNNYLGFLNVFSKYMIRKRHIKANPVEAFQKKPKQEKKRIIFSREDLKSIFDYLQRKDPYYFTACAMVYFQLVRRTEMSKLKVSDINLKERYILLRGEVSKNLKTQTVTIVKEFLPYLVDHLKGASNSDFLFSDNGFRPGPVQSQPKVFSDTWSKYRKLKKWRREYQFYGLKDTGITNLLEAGVAPIHVRDHARHHDIKMTMEYVPFKTNVNPEYLDGKLKM